MIRPNTTDTAITAVVCLTSDCFSGQIIFLNSAERPVNQLSFGALSNFSVSPIFSLLCHARLIWFLCVTYGSCRICNTFWFPSCQDELFCLLSCCSYGFCIPYMPMLFLCAQLPPPLKFFVLFSAPVSVVRRFLRISDSP
jgi:hypothetical protein